METFTREQITKIINGIEEAVYSNPKHCFASSQDEINTRIKEYFKPSEEEIMEENKMDMDFQVGDKIDHVLGYTGEIKNITSDTIKVRLNNGDLDTYYPDGKGCTDDIYPSIYHSGSIKREGSKIIIDPVKPMREKWVNVYLDGDGEPYLGTNRYKSEFNAKQGILLNDPKYITTIQLKRSKP